MGQATIFAGQKIKTLKDALSLNGQSDIISRDVNPQTSAVDAKAGSLLLNPTSGTMYRKLDAGSTTNWVEVGAGTGGKNYIKNPDFDGGATTSWSMQKVSLSSFIPTGNIGAADAGHTIATSSSSPLEGANSLLVQGASAFTAGNCLVSAAFTIDREDVAKVMGWSFSYEAITTNMDFSGTTANTWAVYIAEVTTATPDTVVSWLQPAGVYNLTQGVGVGLASGTFQTTATETSAYRIVLVCINSEAAATTLKVDDFQLGPQKVVYGSPVTDWVSYPITVRSSSGSITNYTASARYRRVGDSVEVIGNLTFSAASAVFSNLVVSIPSGLTINTSKSVSSRLGSGSVIDAGVGFYPLEVIYVNPTEVAIYVGNAAGTYLTDNNITNAIPITFGLNDSISFYFTVPVQGWSSSVQMSQDTDTRLVAASAYRSSPGQTITAASTDETIIFNTKQQDTHSAYNIATGIYTVPVAGLYRVSYNVRFLMGATAASSVYAAVFKNGAAPYLAIWRADDLTNSKSYTASASTIISCNAGDTLKIIADCTGQDVGVVDSATSSETSTFSIERLSGPATIASSETVGFNASNNAGDPIGTLLSLIKFTSIEDNTHGAYSASTGLFTAPVSGRYSASWMVTTQAVTLSTSERFVSILHKNGSIYRNGQRILGTGALTTFSSGGSVQDIKLNAGDTLSIYAVSSVATNANSGASEPIHFSVIKTGN